MKSILVILVLVAVASANGGVANQISYPKDFFCEACKFIVAEAEKFLDEGTEDIVGALDGLCDSLPGFLAGPCHDVVNQYIDQIIDGLINDNPPEQVCMDIELCP